MSTATPNVTTATSPIASPYPDRAGNALGLNLKLPTTVLWLPTASVALAWTV